MPTAFDRRLNTSAEMIAPALPHAADVPCASALKRVGNTSAGYTYERGEIMVGAEYGGETYVCCCIRAKVEEELTWSAGER